MAEPGRRMFPVLAGQPFETWQVAPVCLPLWFPKEGRPTRQWVVVCLRVSPLGIETSEPGSQEEIPRLLESVLSAAGWKWRCRPARVEVADPELARTLEELLAPQDVRVERVADPPMLQEATNNLIDSMTEDPRPSPLTGAGVTVERLRAFARAAAQLYASRAWRYLTADDLVEVEAPAGAEGFRCFVLSRENRATLRGLMFFRSREDFEEVSEIEDDDALDPERAHWALEFEPVWEAPPSDLDLWERFGLPWAGEDRCPIAYLLSEELERPDRRQLAFLEGLAAALAATSEQDLDAGRWKKRVATSEGSMKFVLSLPGLLAPEKEVRPVVSRTAAESSLRQIHKLLQSREFASIEEANAFLSKMVGQGLPDSQPETPVERAQDLVDRAWETPGRRAVLLARQALKIWPDCADAYNVLASRAPDDEAARDLYAEALAAGRRALGSQFFEEEVGRFWGLLETRPYMRALQGRAEALLALELPAEAAEPLQEMLRLNPNDNQGARHLLVNVLIAADQDAEAEALLDRFKDDDWALMAFPRALLRFRREGDSFAARRWLQRACRANRFVPGFLLGARPIPPAGASFSPGKEDEAAVYCELSQGTWETIPGALDWLQGHTAPPPRPKAKGRSPKPRRKKKRRR